MSDHTIIPHRWRVIREAVAISNIENDTLDVEKVHHVCTARRELVRNGSSACFLVFCWNSAVHMFDPSFKWEGHILLLEPADSLPGGEA